MIYRLEDNFWFLGEEFFRVPNAFWGPSNPVSSRRSKSSRRLVPSRRAMATKTNERKLFRCAVYTRKSSKHGLEQDFNSLDAQREAAEAAADRIRRRNAPPRTTGLPLAAERTVLALRPACPTPSYPEPVKSRGGAA